MADTNVNNVGSNVGNTKTSIASEYTLNELLLAFKASSGVSDKQLKALKGLSDHYKPGKDGNEKASKGFGKLSDAADALEGSLRNIPKHFENFDDFLTKGAQKPVNALGGQIQKLSHGFGTFADAMPKWTKFFGTGIIATAFGTLGTTAGILTGYLQNSLDAFKDLSSVGGNFGNSIIDMRKAALRGNLSLDEFSDLVKQNSELFATIGTNVSQGATTFADLSNKVRKFGDQRLKTLGYTVGDVNDMLVDYLDIASKTSDIQSELGNDQTKVIESAVKFGTELNELSAITGLSRKQISKEIKDVASRGEVQAGLLRAQMRGVDNVDAKFRTLIGAVTPFGKTAINAASDLASFGGAFRTPESRAILKAAPNFANAVKQYSDALESNESDVADVGQAYTDMVMGIQADTPQLMRMANAGNKEAIQIMQETAGIRNRYKKYEGEELKRKIAQDAKDAAAKNKLGQGLMKLDEVFRDVQSKIIKTFVSSQIFEKMVAGFDFLADWFASSSFTSYLDQFVGALEKGLNWISNIFTEDGRQYILRDISNLWEEALLWLRETLVKSSFYRWLTGDTGEDLQLRKDNLTAQKELQTIVGRELELKRDIAILEVQHKNAITEGNGVLEGNTAGLIAAKKEQLEKLAVDRAAKVATAAATEQKLNDIGEKTLQNKVNDAWDSFIKTIEKASTTLFTEEGREVMANQITNMFNRILLGMESAFQNSWLLRQLLSNKQVEEWGHRRATTEKETERVTIDTGLYEKNKEIKNLNERLDAAKKAGNINEENRLEEQKRINKDELDILEKRKKDITEQLEILKNMTASKKSELGKLMNRKGDIEDTIKKNQDAIADIFNTTTVKDRLKGMGVENIQQLKEKYETDPTFAGKLISGSGADGAKLQSLSNLISGTGYLATNTALLEELNKQLQDIQSREEGGGTGNGGLFKLHANEYVLNDGMIQSLNSIFSDMGRINLSNVRNPLLENTSKENSITKEAEKKEDRIRSIADYSKPEQEQFKTTLDSKLLLTELLGNNEEYLHLFKQHLVYQEQLTRDIGDILDIYEKNK